MKNHRNRSKKGQNDENRSFLDLGGSKSQILGSGMSKRSFLDLGRSFLGSQEVPGRSFLAIFGGLLEGVQGGPGERTFGRMSLSSHLT